MTEHLEEFSRRLFEEWLPTYCHDPKRNYQIEGFIPGSIKVTNEDARDFMRALDSGVVWDTGGSRFQAARSKATEYIFWEHEKTKIPRPITLWLEPVITIAAVARVHLDYGWPKELLGLQSEKWSFDLTAFLPDQLNGEYIAGEVKKTAKEVETLLKHMRRFGEEPELPAERPAKQDERNALAKCVGLVTRRAPYFWVVGPHPISRLFRIAYAAEKCMTLNEVSLDELRFPLG